MNPAVLAVCVALAGGVGAMSRYLTDRAITDRFGNAVPFGTMTVNIADGKHYFDFEYQLQ